jgi:phosphoribosylanthranilate isomerase
MVKVKICGITNLEDAEAALVYGCDALGFVFYRKSKRYISPAKAKKIISKLSKKRVLKIGVFVNSRERTIKDIAAGCNLDILQFHGNESPAFIGRFKGHKIIKAFRVRDKFLPKDIREYNVFAYLFDTFIKESPGGTGRAFNWDLLSGVRNILKRPVFLSGGLDEKNVLAAIKKVRPAWVDVSSGVESVPGKKDKLRLERFIRVVKNIRK